jgi:hypothetical protein
MTFVLEKETRIQVAGVEHDVIVSLDGLNPDDIRKAKTPNWFWTVVS